MDTEDLKQLGKTIEDALKGKDSRTARKTALEELALTKEGAAIQKLSNREIKKVISLNKSLKKHETEHEDHLKKINVTYSKLDDNLRAVRSSLRTFGSAAYAGTGSISEFTESLRGSSTVLNFVADLGKTFDVNAETFRGLAEVGGNFNQSIVEMRNAAHMAALPLDDFAKLVRDNSTTLAALYGTTTKGAIGIAGLGEALRTQATPELASLGFTVDEINETLLTNLDRQRRTGLFDSMTNQQRVQSAANLAKELDRLAKLTGQQRSELRAQLDQQKSNARFAAFRRTLDDETDQRISTFAATIGAISPMLNEGMEDLLANAGVPVTDAAMQLVQNFPEVQQTIKSLIAGTINSEQALMQVRDLSVKSLQRFSAAAATGQVPFLELTPGIIEMASLTLDQVAALKEQQKAQAGGTSSLMQFQENAKRLSAATQSLETGFYSMLGSLGGEGTDSVVSSIGDMSDKFITGTSNFTKAILYGTKTISGLGLNLLKDTLPTYTAVYMGTKAGNLSSGSMFGGMGGGIKGGLNSKMGKGLGAIGAIGTAGMSVAGLVDDDKSNDVSSWTGLAGSVLGGIAGFMVGGPGGAMLGATLGNMAGSAVGGMFGGEKSIGGNMSAGVPYLTGERGPEIVTPNVGSSVTSNANLNSALNFKPLELKMTNMVTELNTANKKLTNMVDGVNMLVGVNGKIARSTEGTLRVQKTQTGQILSA
jgi:hypothetical protein